MTSLDEARRALHKSGIAIGQIYRHYKGAYYKITSVGLLEASLTPLIGYTDTADGEYTWYRPLDDFQAEVGFHMTNSIYPTAMKRFTLIDD